VKTKKFVGAQYSALLEKLSETKFWLKIIAQVFGRAEMITKVARRCLIMMCSIVLLFCYILREIKLCLIDQLNNQILSWIFAQSKTGDYKFHVVNLLCHATLFHITLLCILSTSFSFFTLLYCYTVQAHALCSHTFYSKNYRVKPRLKEV